MLPDATNETDEVEGSFGETEAPPPGPGDTESSGGSDTDGSEFNEVCLFGDAADQPEVDNPVRYLCNGNGGGELRWLQCGQADPLNLGCDIDNQSDVDVEFPPDPNDPDADPDLDAQVCCEPGLLNLPDGETIADAACIEDCARAACNETIRILDDRLDGLAPGGGCNANCTDRTRAALTTWRDYLVENYEDCLGSARNPDFDLFLPNADIPLQLGAAYDAVLELDCAITADPVETQTSCEENFNPEDGAEGSGWECGVSGFATYVAEESSTTTTVDGTMAFRVGDCGTASDCWYQVNALDLDADPVSSSDGTLRWGTSELAYPLFGRYDTSTDEGTAPKLMLGLDASAYILPQGGQPAAYDVRIKNSEATDVEVAPGSFTLGEAVFAWSSGERLILRFETVNCLTL